MAIKLHSVKSGPRILALDVEMSFNVSYHYDQWKVNIPWTHIKQRQFMISAAWQWIGSDNIYTACVLDDKARFEKDHTDDYHVIKSLKDEIDQADAVIAYNGRRFDIKEINTGLDRHRLGPLHEFVLLDPIQIAKSKFRFKGGNSLANLCNLFELPVQKGKVELEDWIGATEGNKESIKKVVEYNITDIPTMVMVWERIKPFAPSKLNMNHFVDADVCSHCGSPDLKLHMKKKATRATIRYQYRCQDCHGFTTTGKTIRTENFR